jgi:hypothetical protein
VIAKLGTISDMRGLNRLRRNGSAGLKFRGGSGAPTGTNVLVVSVICKLKTVIFCGRKAIGVQDDGHGIRILLSCRQGMQSDARVVIIEMILVDCQARFWALINPNMLLSCQDGREWTWKNLMRYCMQLGCSVPRFKPRSLDTGRSKRNRAGVGRMLLNDTNYQVAHVHTSVDIYGCHFFPYSSLSRITLTNTASRGRGLHVLLSNGAQKLAALDAGQYHCRPISLLGSKLGRASPTILRSARVPS